LKSVQIPHPLPDELADRIAERFRLLGEPMRVKLLDRLREQPATVQELTDPLGTTQQNVSKHLGLLHRAAVVTRERDGNRVRYAIADDSVLALCEQVCGGLQLQLEELERALAGVTPGGRRRR
jgi:DNA-binding transcriptional ArsR family regulator